MSCGEWGQAFLVVCRLLIAVASLVVERGQPQGMWDLPGPGIELVSPALAGGFLTIGPLGKSPGLFQLLFSLRVS